MRWDKYKKAYLHAFLKMLEGNKAAGCGFRKKGAFGADPTEKDVFNWWMEYDILPGQIDWFEDFEEEGD